PRCPPSSTRFPYTTLFRSISGVPIVEPDGKLVGILTNRALRFETDMSRRVEELMTSEGLVTVPVGTTLEHARDILRSHKVEKLRSEEHTSELQSRENPVSR